MNENPIGPDTPDSSEATVEPQITTAAPQPTTDAQATEAPLPTTDAQTTEAPSPTTDAQATAAPQAAPAPQTTDAPAAPAEPPHLAAELHEYLIAWPASSQIQRFLNQFGVEEDAAQPILEQICGHFLENGELHHARIIAESGAITIGKALKGKAEDALCRWLETGGAHKWEGCLKIFLPVYPPRNDNFMTAFKLKMTVKILTAANNGYAKALESGQDGAANFISQHFRITRITEEHRTAATAGVIKLLHDKDFSSARSMATQFDIEGEKIDMEIVTVLLKLIGENDIEELIALGEKFIPTGGYEAHEQQLHPVAIKLIGRLDRGKGHNRKATVETLVRFNHVFGITLTLSEKISIQKKIGENDDLSHFTSELEALGIDSGDRKTYRTYRVVEEATERFTWANLNRRQVKELLKDVAARFGQPKGKELSRDLAAVMPIYIENHPYQLKQCVHIASTLPTNKRAIKQSVLDTLKKVVRLGAKSEVDSPDKRTVALIKEVFGISDVKMAGIFAGYTAEVFKKEDLPELQRLVRLGLAVASEEEIKQFAMNACLREVEAGDIDGFRAISDKFGFVAKDIPDQAALDRAALEGFSRLIHCRDDGRQAAAMDFARTFSIPGQEQIRVANETIGHILDGDPDHGLGFANKITCYYLRGHGTLSPGNAEKVTTAIGRQFENEQLDHGTYDGIRLSARNFWLEEEKIDRIFLNIVLGKFEAENVDIDQIAAVCRSRNLLENEDIRQAATDLFVKELDKGELNRALQIKDAFGIAVDVGTEDRMLAAVKRNTAATLESMLTTAIRANPRLAISPEYVRDIANQIVEQALAAATTPASPQKGSE